MSLMISEETVRIGKYANMRMPARHSEAKAGANALPAVALARLGVNEEM